MTLPVLGTSTKVEKGEGLGYLTKVLYLSPAKQSGYNLCPSSSEGCEASCLGHSSGRLAMPQAQAGQLRKTKFLIEDRAAFIEQLEKDITKLVARAEKMQMTPAVRLNGSSDLAWEQIARRVFDNFPTVAFYDYTKRYRRMERFLAGLNWPENYRMVFSANEKNWLDVWKTLALGGGVAVVTDNVPGLKAFVYEQMNEGGQGDWRRKEQQDWIRFIDGDNNDFRYADYDTPGPFVVSLKPKGAARHDQTGFVFRKGW